jgi:hypothetical protein
VTPSAPRVPNFKQDSLSICWKGCNVDAIDACQVVWSGPTPADDCRNYAKRFKLKDAAGTVKWNGRIKFRYSRTWIETDFAGNQYQVWRYLANGDVRPTAAAGGTPCPVPPCAPLNGNKVRYTGYVDYALDCSTGLREFAWMLTHSCDLIDHAPGFPRSGAFHPDRAYTFVGPAAGFVVGALQPVESGGGMLEAVRRIARIPGTTLDTCEPEERIQHGMTTINTFCLCGALGDPAQYAISDVAIAGSCGTTVNSITTPLPGYVTMGLGIWTDPTKFPGPEILRWNAAAYAYGDPCDGVVRNEVFFGVTTHRGWPAETVPDPVFPSVPLPGIFVDPGNSLLGVLGNVTMNRPYRSNHILNLNY